MNDMQEIGQKLTNDRNANFRGTAQINFQNLDFIHVHDRKRDDEKQIEHLKNRYETIGCRRLDAKYHIPAVIDQATLDEAIRKSKRADKNTLLCNPETGPPELEFPSDFRIVCLDGRLRVAAGKAHLPERDWLWAIDLFVKDGSADLQTALSEEYSNSINFSDGEIYLKYRYYDKQKPPSKENVYAKMCMLTRLDQPKKGDFNQLLKHEAFLAAFDALQVFPGLWYGFQIAHKWVGMKCDEPIICYAENIFNVLNQIFGGQERLFGSLNRATAEKIQSRAPGISKEDLNALKEPFFQENSTLFPSIKDPGDRQMIWENLQNVTSLIPTLFTLFEDIKYLNEPATVMRQLFGLFGKNKRTIRQEMYHKFSNKNLTDGECFIQESENSCRIVQCSSDDQFELHFLDVWLFACRDWPKLNPKATTKKEVGEKTPVPQTSDPKKRYQLAAFAKKRGFGSEEIDRILSMDADRKRARDFLLDALPSEEFEYDKHALENFISQIADMIESATQKPQKLTHPTLLVNGRGEDLKRRYGRTFDKAYKSDRKYLFLDNLYRPREGEGGGVSSFLVRSSVYFAFFGSYSTYSITVAPRGQITKNLRLTQAINTAIDNMVVEEANGVSIDRPKLGNVSLDFGPAVNIGTKPPTAPIDVLERPEEMPLPPIAETRELNDEEGLFEAEDMTPQMLIQFWEGGKLNIDKTVRIEYDRSAVDQAFSKTYRDYFIFDIYGKALSKEKVFDAVTSNGTKTIILSEDEKVNVSRPLVAATAESVQNSQAITVTIKDRSIAMPKSSLNSASRGPNGATLVRTAQDTATFDWATAMFDWATALTSNVPIPKNRFVPKARNRLVISGLDLNEDERDRTKRRAIGSRTPGDARPGGDDEVRFATPNAVSDDINGRVIEIEGSESEDSEL